MIFYWLLHLLIVFNFFLISFLYCSSVFLPAFFNFVMATPLLRKSKSKKWQGAPVQNNIMLRRTWSISSGKPCLVYQMRLIEIPILEMLGKIWGYWPWLHACTQKFGRAFAPFPPVPRSMVQLRIYNKILKQNNFWLNCIRCQSLKSYTSFHVSAVATVKYALHRALKWSEPWSWSDHANRVHDFACIFVAYLLRGKGILWRKLNFQFFYYYAI